MSEIIQVKYHALVTSFPSILAQFPTFMDGTPEGHVRDSDWIIEVLVAWLGDRGISRGERHSALFCLNLWNRGGQWDAFDVFQALDDWDRPHQQAFAAWAAKPWRP